MTRRTTAGTELNEPATTARHGEILRRKPFLKRIYDEWYDAIEAELPVGPEPVLELGSGAGFFAERVRGVIPTDVVPCSGIRLVLDGAALPLGQGSIRAITMVNVLHHLADPSRFMSEAARCVRPRGRVIMIEPWVTAWSRLVYGRLHHEPFAPDAETWESPVAGRLSGANSAAPWIMFQRDRARFLRDFPAWRIVAVRPMMPFRYVLSGGLSAPGLAPAWSYGLWRTMEAGLQPWAGSLAMFAMVLLERSEAPA